GDRAEDTGATGLVVGLDDDGGVLIKADVGAVGATGLLLGADDDGLDDLAGLHVAARGGLLDRSDDGVANASKASTGTAEHADAQNFTCTGVVGDLETRFLLDHDGSP